MIANFGTPWRPKTQRLSGDRELNQAWSSPSIPSPHLRCVQVKVKVKVWTLSDSLPATLYNLGSGRWLARAISYVIIYFILRLASLSKGHSGSLKAGIKQWAYRCQRDCRSRLSGSSPTWQRWPRRRSTAWRTWFRRQSLDLEGSLPLADPLPLAARRHIYRIVSNSAFRDNNWQECIHCDKKLARQLRQHKQIVCCADVEDESISLR